MKIRGSVVPYYLVVIVALALMVLVVFLYGQKFGLPPKALQDWGPFGDYVGGILNPILSFLALLILIFTLSATRDALKQNEKILELSQEELRLTRNQIADTEVALKKQTKIVRSSAHAERLSDYARRVYDEILIFQDNKKMTQPLLRQEDGSYHPSIVFNAFDCVGSNFSKIRRKDEWGDDWNKTFNETLLGDLISRMEELMRLCITSYETTKENEASAYYFNRLDRWLSGGVELGYLSREIYDEFCATCRFKMKELP